VVDELPGLRAITRKTKAVDHIVQARFERLKHVQTGHTFSADSQAKVAPELALKNAINAASPLFGAQLASIIRLTLRASLFATAVLARSKTTLFKGAFRRVAALSLQIKFFTFSPA
jgi:hypothetical protein